MHAFHLIFFLHFLILLGSSMLLFNFSYWVVWYYCSSVTYYNFFNLTQAPIFAFLLHFIIYAILVFFLQCIFSVDAYCIVVIYLSYYASCAHIFLCFINVLIFYLLILLVLFHLPTFICNTQLSYHSSISISSLLVQNLVENLLVLLLAKIWIISKLSTIYLPPSLFL